MSAQPVARDRLILLDRVYADPAHDGRRFYCEHCIVMEGVLAAFPELLSTLEVSRVGWARPRGSVVALLGEGNQNLPVLLLSAEGPCGGDSTTHDGQRYVSDKDAILRVLALRHGVPLPHP